jgi:DeoR/GlpR family transcriptional regulator of sugar metabolism
VLKEERQRRILGVLAREGRVVATELQRELGVSGYTIRRDLDELAEARHLQRVHGGALARSTVAPTYAERREQSVPGKRAVARAAAKVLEPGQTVIVDGGSTALHFVDAIPPDYDGTFVTHSPPVAAALAGRDVVVVGGSLDARAMVCVGAQTIAAYSRITADVCFLGVWAVHATAGLSTGHHEEAELRRVLVQRADRVVGLASRDKLGTTAPFGIAPATALTHLATEPHAPAELVDPFVELGIHVVR